MTKFSFLLVEDQNLLREGLRALLEKEDFVNEIREAANIKQFVDQIKNPVDFVIMDFRLADTNALMLLPLLKKGFIQPKVIILTGLEGTELLLNLLKTGVHGITYKLDGYAQIIKTIHGVLDTGSYLPERILRIIQNNSHRWDQLPPVSLSLPELDLLKAIASGLTTKEIASLLKMSDATAETYRIRLIKKLRVQNTAGLIAYAYRNGIL